MTDLWVRYFGLGGMSTPIELEAYMLGALQPTSQEHNLVAYAINEHHVEQGGATPSPMPTTPTDTATSPRRP